LSKARPKAAVVWWSIFFFVFDNEPIRSWYGMIRRCREENCEQWKNYGGRGIKVCDRWFSFENFLADMGKRPSRIHSLDRRDVDGNYEPSNCRWATPSQQCNNRRNNIFVTIHGEILPFSLAAEKFSVVSIATSRARFLHGWSADDAFFTPLYERPS